MKTGFLRLSQATVDEDTLSNHLENTHISTEPKNLILIKDREGNVINAENHENWSLLKIESENYKDKNENEQSNNQENGKEHEEEAEEQRHEQEHQEINRNVIIDCGICLEEHQEGYLLRNCTCQTYCTKCLGSFLKEKIFSGGVLDLRCPNCNSRFHEEDIHSLVDTHTFTKYQQFLFVASLRAEPNCRWCPNPTCSSPVLRQASATSPLMNCPSCNTSFCFDCSDYWHPDKTCLQNAKDRKKSKTEVKSERRKMRAGKPCPGCGAIIDKYAGCNHIVCVYCKFEWCWVCHQEFKPDHYFNTTCKGLQYTNHPHLKKAGLKSLKAGKYSLIAVGVGVTGVLALAVGIPTVAVGLPIYGGYRLLKKVAS